MLISLLIIPILGILLISMSISYNDTEKITKYIKYIALNTTIINLILSIYIYILYDFSVNQFQFVQEYHKISFYDFYLGIDGLSIYFILLTTLIIPVSLLSN